MNAGRPLSAVTAPAVIVAVGGLTTACGSDGTSTETSVVTVTTTSPSTGTLMPTERGDDRGGGEPGDDHGGHSGPG